MLMAKENETYENINRLIEINNDAVLVDNGDG
jgi:hypothetical protein